MQELLAFVHSIYNQTLATMITIDNDPNEDLMTLECALKIVQHLEKNIVRHRENINMASKLASMNKFIQMNYIHNMAETA